MSFTEWFKNWIHAFIKLLTFDRKKVKTDSQRKRDRERRLKAKYSSANLYRKKRKIRNRSTPNKRLIKAIIDFIGASLGILLLPLGLLDYGIKSAKTRKASAGGRSLDKSKRTFASSQEKKTQNAEREGKSTSTQNAHPVINSSVTNPGIRTKESTCTVPLSLNEHTESQTIERSMEVSTVTKSDENTPKSTPKNEKDQYIRKRMIIAGSYYCDNGVIDALKVGTSFDLEAEPENLYDKDAVKLTLNGKKIGYVPKQDRLAFVACLKLGRKIYGVITDIKDDNGQIKYEFETWFDSAK